ncbi:major facilitator-like protein 5 [Plakobranchus ocellatus]|uniref:Major facilitator-like protein 5 n=1 Tax=Plakobranchus ocellatus TaxID=259542 RepID=A0AAV4CVQ3_9GAST|nr:major facilitator-like protein 5 [Plakobranchus ocellatus]
MVASGLMENWLGMRRTIFLGGMLSSLSLLFSCFAMCEPAALVFLYGFVNGIGTGLLYSLCAKVIFQAISSKKGLASGVMSAFQSVGSLINIGLAFAVVNPTNKEPDVIVNNTNFFSDKDLINRVPYYFVAIGLLTIMSSLSGFLMVQYFSKDFNDRRIKNEERLELVDDGEPEKQKLVQETAEDVASSTLNGPLKQTAETEVFASDDHASSRNNNMNDIDTCLYESTTETKGNMQNSSEVPNRTTCATLAENSEPDKGIYGSDLTPWEAVKTMRFWTLWFVSLFLAHTFYVLTNLFKQYGLLEITNDQVLVVTGILSTVTLIATRPLAGIFSDRFGVKMTMVMTCAVSSVFMNFMVLTLRYSPALYIINTIIEFSCSSTYFIISSLVVNELFSTTHYPSLIGLVYTARMISSFVDPILVDAIVATFGWDWVFLSGSAAGVVSLIISLALPETGM